MESWKEVFEQRESLELGQLMEKIEENLPEDLSETDFSPKLW